MSTWPFWMNDSRLADTVSVHVMSSGAMPSFPAMIFAISTSKPSGTLVRGFSRPKPGWSIFVPTVIVPASLSRAMVVPGSKLTSVSTAEVSSAVSWACWPASLEQPARASPRAARVAA
jgi:hypothetical protein